MIQEFGVQKKIDIDIFSFLCIFYLIRPVLSNPFLSMGTHCPARFRPVQPCVFPLLFVFFHLFCHQTDVLKCCITIGRKQAKVEIAAVKHPGTKSDFIIHIQQ